MPFLPRPRNSSPSEAAAAPAVTGLPERTQDDLIQGTKYARLNMDEHGEAYFTGIGYQRPYRTEALAECGRGQDHLVPDPECTCGFWIPVREESALSSWEPDQVKLEVEIGGRIANCGHEPLPAPPWGYRAQWQRVLSVSLSAQCGAQWHHGGPCTGPVSSLVRWGTGVVVSSCARHSMLPDAEVISTPVSWLRRSLQTEIRPGTILDETTEGADGWRGAVRLVTQQLCPMAELVKVVPDDPAHGQVFRVCADIPAKLVYDLQWDGRKKIWEVRSIYHPALAKWGWGTPRD